MKYLLYIPVIVVIDIGLLVLGIRLDEFIFVKSGMPGHPVPAVTLITMAIAAGLSIFLLIRMVVGIARARKEKNSQKAWKNNFSAKDAENIQTNRRGIHTKRDVFLAVFISESIPINVRDNRGFR